MSKVKHISKKLIHELELMAVLALGVIFIIASSILGYWYEHRESGPREGNNSASTAAAYKNLDLAIARNAVYRNQAVRVVSDLGAKDKVRRQIINFSVPNDGLSEYGLMTTPVGKPPEGGYPVVILCHGYVRPSHYSTTRDNLADMDFYTQHGFAVIKPDFRGQGMSLHSGTPEGAYYSMGYNTDVMSLIAAVKETSYLNSGQIAIWGHSMGGYIALRAAVLSPDIKRVILLAAPVGTPQDLFKLYTPISDTDNIASRRIKQSQLAAHGTPLSNPAFWNPTSPLNNLDSFTANVQIFVGRNDQIVPMKFSQELNNALSKHHKAHEFYVYASGTHSLVQQRPLIWSASLQQLEEMKSGY